MNAELIHIGDAFGPHISTMMRATLDKGVPQGGGAAGAITHFGLQHEAICYLCVPVAIAIDGMLPGFKLWLEATGFGDDKYMMMTLAEMANHLAKFRPPSDARIRPALLGPPKHH